MANEKAEAAPALEAKLDRTRSAERDKLQFTRGLEDALATAKDLGLRPQVVDHLTEALFQLKKPESEKG